MTAKGEPEKPKGNNQYNINEIVNAMEKAPEKKKATLSEARQRLREIWNDYQIADDLDQLEDGLRDELLSEIRKEVQGMAEHADGMLRKREVLYMLKQMEAEL